MTIKNLEAIEDRVLIIAGCDLPPGSGTEFASLCFRQVHERHHRMREGCRIADWRYRERRVWEEFSRASCLGEDRGKFACAGFHQGDGQTFPA